jgi:beta-phosphoglucomutase-like phosphatase (HAD superfamily)
MHELVIFDCDGVLVDSEVISNEVLARILTREGLPTTLAEARRDYQGLLLADIRNPAEAKLGRSLPHGWLAEYEHERTEAFRHGLEPVAGAAEAVRQVKAAGLKVCVASQARWRRHG